jgi:hypothetical protein
MTFREWRYPLVLGGTLVILVGGAFIAFDALEPIIPGPADGAVVATAAGSQPATVPTTSAPTLRHAPTPLATDAPPLPPEEDPVKRATQPVVRTALPPAERPAQDTTRMSPTPLPTRDTVATAPPPAPASAPWTPAPEQARRDTLYALTRAAGEAAAAGDSVAAARLWGRAVQFAPGDTTLRRLHAEALSWSGDTGGALAGYDALIAENPAPSLLRARASVKVRAGDNSGALVDLAAAEGRESTPRGQVLMGDLHRWMGDRNASRDAYERALAMDRSVPGAREGLADLGRTAVRDLPWDVDEGTTTAWSTIDDNTGFQTGALRVQHGIPLGFERRTVVVMALEAREVERDLSWLVGPRAVDVRAGELGVTHRRGGVRTTARVGAAAFVEAGEMLTWTGGVEWRPGGNVLSGLVARGPAFETLRAGATLGSALGSDSVLSAVTAAATFSRQLGERAEVWARAELLGLGDDNRRTTTQVALRAGVAPGIYLLYAGGWLSFAEATQRYWSPRSYTLQGLGLEYRHIWRSGAYLTAQAQPGMAWFTQDLPGGGVERDHAAQWQLTGETGWRKPRWEVTLASAFGRDREGSYQAATGLLRARYRW